MITDSQAKAGPFVGDGMTTEYDFAFPALSADHIAVYVDEVKITSGYTAALLPGGGRVTLDEPLPEGARLAIVRDVPFEQVVDLQNNTAFLPEVIETALDRLTMICQQLRESLSRAVTLPPTDAGQTWDEIYPALIQASADAADVLAAAAQVLTVTSGTLTDLSGAAVSIAPWGKYRWSMSGACTLSLDAWPETGVQIALLLITAAPLSTLDTPGVEQEDTIDTAGEYLCYITKQDGKAFFSVARFVTPEA